MANASVPPLEGGGQQAGNAGKAGGETDLHAVEARMMRNLGVLALITEASGFVVEPIAKEDITPGTEGWQTLMNRKPPVIQYNPNTFREHKGDDKYIEGLLAHEAGHHEPNVRRYQDAMHEDYRAPPLMSKLYDDNGFLLHCHAALADVVDEAVMGREPYLMVRERLAHFNREIMLNVEKVVGMTVKALGGTGRPCVLAASLPALVEFFYKDHPEAGRITDEAAAFTEQALSDNPPADLEGKLSPELGQAVAAYEGVLGNWGGQLDPQMSALRDSVRGSIVGYLKRLPKPEQYVQLLLKEGRYPSGYPPEDMVDADVLEAYKRTMDAGAMAALTDSECFQKPFLRERYLDMAHHARVDAYRPRDASDDKARVTVRSEYMKLVEAEIQERAKSKKGKKGKEGKPRRGGYGGMPGSVPMTKEERQQLLKDLLERLKGGKGGKGEGEPIKLTPEELKQLAKELRGELDALADKYLSECDKDRRRREALGKDTTGEKPTHEPDFWDMLRRLMDEMADKDLQNKARGLGTKHGVPPEIVDEYFRLRDRYRTAINNGVEDLTEVFRDNRLTIIQYARRQGEIMPGLEAEHLSEVLSGNPEPDTMMQEVENPDFAKTQVLFVVDTSGSMGGSPNKACRGAIVVEQETFEGVRDSLQGENLLRPEEEVPLQTGVSMFDTQHHPIHQLGQPVTERSKIHIIHRLHEVGGGTDDAANVAIDLKELKEFDSSNPNVIKILVIMSDVFGNEDRMRQIAHQIYDDKSIICLMMGFGSNAEQVSKIWGQVASEAGLTNVFAKAFPGNSVEEATPYVTAFLREQVPPRVREMTRKFRGY